MPGLKAAWNSELGTRVLNVTPGEEKGTRHAQRERSNPCFSFLHPVMPRALKDSVIAGGAGAWGQGFDSGGPQSLKTLRKGVFPFGSEELQAPESGENSHGFFYPLGLLLLGPPKWVHNKTGGLKPQLSGQRTVKGSPSNLEELGEQRRGKSSEEQP